MSETSETKTVDTAASEMMARLTFEGRVVVTLLSDGSFEPGPAYTTDSEAAKAFWRAVGERGYFDGLEKFGAVTAENERLRLQILDLGVENRDLRARLEAVRRAYTSLPGQKHAAEISFNDVPLGMTVGPVRFGPVEPLGEVTVDGHPVEDSGTFGPYGRLGAIGPFVSDEARKAVHEKLDRMADAEDDLRPARTCHSCQKPCGHARVVLCADCYYKWDDGLLRPADLSTDSVPEIKTKTVDGQTVRTSFGHNQIVDREPDPDKYEGRCTVCGRAYPGEGLAEVQKGKGVYESHCQTCGTSPAEQTELALDEPPATNPLTPMKKCCRCQRLRSLDAFHKQSKSKDGRQPHCKECKRAMARMDKLRKKGQQTRAEIEARRLREKELEKEEAARISQNAPGCDKLRRYRHTTATLAAVLKVSRAVVYDMVVVGMPHKRKGRGFRFSGPLVWDWIATSKTEAASRYRTRPGRAWRYDGET